MIVIYVAIILSIYLVVAAGWDLRTLRIPSWLTVPAVAAVLVWRTWQLDMAFLPFWFGCMVAWQLHWVTAGDAQVLMVLFGFFPNVLMLYVLVLVAGLGLATVLVARYRRAQALPLLFRRFRYQLADLSFVRPSKAELEWAGEPFTIFITMAGLIYIWMFAIGLGG